MEVELPNIHKATSSDHWSLTSSQYPSGKFPKVSVGIMIPKAGSIPRARGGDATPTPTFDRNLSQGTDGLSRPKGTFSFGTRREQGISVEKLETPEFLSSQRKRNTESADKAKPNSEMLRMKLWEILGGTSQNKQAAASPNPDDMETPDQPKGQTVKGPSSGNKEVFTSPFLDNIKTPDPLKRQTVNFTKCKLSLDPIESDSDSPKVDERRPVTRSLGRKKALASSKKQSRSSKKPLSTFQSTPKKKMLDNVFIFNEKCTPKTVDQGETNKATESRGSRSPDSAKKRVNRKQPYLSPTEDEGIKSSETSFAKGYKSHKWPSDIDVPDKSPVEHMGRKSNLKEDRMSKRRLSSAAPFPTAATQENTDSDKEQEQCPENFLTRAFDQASKELSKSAKKPFSTFHSTPKKKMQGNVFTFNEKRAPKTVDQDKMNQTTESPGSESPGSAEERENSKQPSHSPLSPTEDEGTQGSKSSEQSFAKGYKSQKWIPDIKGTDKSPLEYVGRKTKLKEDRMNKRYLSSPTPFATSVSDKDQEQCPENYLTRAFDQLIVVLGRFQTKIKSETSKKSSEILAATRETICQHLEGVEAQMQADVDKLVNAGRSKRKRLESTFEDQQEKLRILHEKFKEEVNKQLLNCRSSLEDFESYHAELKGVADKQKSSHKKLLANAEKTVGAQLNDAETKIAEVQKRARKRMNGLKYVLKELITETVD
uniref:Desynaptic2 n=1 Tax=Zea mays TaxID=4577 RepID=A0A804PF56_MAIZE